MNAFLFNLTEEDLKAWMLAHQEKPFRASQVFEWIYGRGVTNWDLMTNLGQPLRKALSDQFKIFSLKLVETIDSIDGDTTKFLWELADGKYVESVLIRAPDRRTVCVSSQVGCGARCAFCASGKGGFVRQLEAAEILEQVIQIDQWLKKNEERVSHIVFMGMGEPLDNYDHVLKTIRLLTSPGGLNISQRRITVSTVGVVEGIERLGDEDLKVNLVLSLHAPNQNTRKKIIPYARKYALEDVLASMLVYAKKTKRDITYEYTLMAGINDSLEQAKELSLLVRGHPCTVNLIPYNPVPGLKLHRPEKEQIEAFRDVLVEAGIPTTWRYTKGKDIAAACGQLALKQSKLELI